jgi:hypothetical protein
MCRERLLIGFKASGGMLDEWVLAGHAVERKESMLHGPDDV